MQDMQDPYLILNAADRIAEQREAEQLAWFVAIIAIAFAAFCVWLTVRIVNRRERWANWTLAAVVGVPVLYVASFGPAIWIASPRDSDISVGPSSMLAIYRPLGWIANETDSPIGRALEWWARCGLRKDQHAVIPSSASSWTEYPKGLVR